VPSKDFEVLPRNTLSSPGARRFLTVKQTAEHLQSTPLYVRDLIARGVLPALKLSARKTLIPVEALDRIEDAAFAGRVVRGEDA
jgi:excisionase family DNA binding protein